MALAYTIKAEWNNLSGFYQPEEITVKYSIQIMGNEQIKTILLTRQNNWKQVIENDPDFYDIIFDNIDYYNYTVSTSGRTTTITLTEKGFQADNKINQLVINQSTDLIYKKGNYSNTYLIADITGLPDEATLFMTDAQNNQLYSPFDANGNYEKTICTVETTNTKIAIPLPAQYSGDSWIDYPTGVYNWKLRYYGGESYRAKDYPITIQIVDFNTWEVLNPSIYPDENINVKIKTYANTIPPATDLLTTNATYDSNTGIITYPNNDINISIGEHTQLINDKQLLKYIIKDPIEFYIDGNGINSHYIPYMNTLPYCNIGCEIKDDCNLTIKPSTLQVMINDKRYNDYSINISNKLVFNDYIDYNNYPLPPDTYMCQVSAELSNNQRYYCDGSFNINTENCSITLSSPLDEQKEETINITSGIWDGDLTHTSPGVSGTGYIDLSSTDLDYYNYIKIPIQNNPNPPTKFSIYGSDMITDISNIDMSADSDLEFFISYEFVNVVFNDNTYMYPILMDLNHNFILRIYFEDTGLTQDNIIIKQKNKLSDNIIDIPCVVKYRYDNYDPIPNAQISIIDSNNLEILRDTTDSNGNVLTWINELGEYRPAAINIYDERILLGEIYEIKNNILWQPLFTDNSSEEIISLTNAAQTWANNENNIFYIKKGCTATYDVSNGIAQIGKGVFAIGWQNTAKWQCDFDVSFSPRIQYMALHELVGIIDDNYYTLISGWEGKINIAAMKYSGVIYNNIRTQGSEESLFSFGTYTTTGAYGHITMIRDGDYLTITKTGNTGTNGTLTFYADKLDLYERCTIASTSNNYCNQMSYPYISNLIVKEL